MPVVSSVAVRRGGIDALLGEVDRALVAVAARPLPADWRPPGAGELRGAQREADRILRVALSGSGRPDTGTGRADAMLLHPVAGLVILLAILFVMFQAVFAWARPVDGRYLRRLHLARRAGRRERRCPTLLRSFLKDGVIAGVGSVIVFLPQIVILFFFILLLEDLGYMARAAFLMDKIMGGAGLHGRAFIPLLSSLRLRHPGHHGDARDRRPPRSADHHPGGAADDLLGAHSGLYADHLGLHSRPRCLGLHRPAGAGDVRPLRHRHRRRARRVLGGQAAVLAHHRGEPFMLEMPGYKLPQLRSLAIGVWARAMAFLKRAGTTILSMMILIWVLASFPGAPEGATEPPSTTASPP